MSVFKDNSESIGHTPLIRINRLTQGLGATILAKIEGRNPAYSVKCRIGAAMIWGRRSQRKTEAGGSCCRADQRQHGNRARIRLCGTRLPADIDDARNDVGRAPHYVEKFRSKPGADSRCRRNEGRHRQG